MTSPRREATTGGLPRTPALGNHGRSEGDSVSDSGRSVSEQGGRSLEIAPTINESVFYSNSLGSEDVLNP